jgi:hypothetical protein
MATQPRQRSAEDERETIAPDVPQTPLAVRGMAPGEVTVQFRKWHPHGMTAYQKGQYAGFMQNVADELVAQGVAIICLPRAGAAQRMVQK